MKTVTYDELSDIDISIELNEKGEVSCIIKNTHADALKSAWDAYGKYVKSYYAKNNSVVVFFKQVNWLLKRAIVDFRFGNLFQVTDAYLTFSSNLEPVLFEKQENGEVKLTLRLKRK